MTIFGDGSQTRAFSHVEDVAPIIARSPMLKDARNEIFNVGADAPYTVLDLAETICASFGVPANLQHLPARKEVVHAFSDHSKIRRVFGKDAAVSLKDGIERMTFWVKQQGAQRPTRFEHIEVLRNLPPHWI
jgi:UDP-glucose 4-epimerase